MAAIDSSIALFEAERAVFLDSPRNILDVGDIEGPVRASWVGLSDTGLGTVNYKNKLYKTVPLGKKSIPTGTPVIMTFTKGVYFSDW